MEKYDSYKDSGEKWLGLIPSHWQMMRWRFLMEENTKQNTDGRITCQLQFKYGEIVPKANQDVDKDVLETISKYTVVAPGDIMINGLNLNYDFISQRIGQVKENGVITSAYISLRPTSVANRKYLVYLLKSMDSQKLFHGMGTGVRLTLSYKELKNKFLPVPSCEEQSNIVAYLDEQCSKIDEAIAQQQKMIDLLNERKQIIINKAVTKGLNPDVEMKDSGVNWIGLVPAHWKVNKAKFHFATKKEIIGKDFHKYERLALTLKGVIKRQYGDDIGLNPESLSTYQVVQENDLIFKLIDLENISTSRVGLSPYSGLVSPAYIRIFAKDDICHQYFEYYYLNMWHRHIFNDFGSDGVRSNLSASDLLAIKILIPPIDEQLRISQYIKGQTEILNKYLSHLQASIDALNERKQILIGNAVTGKFKI